jgi:hypothetical protein
MAIVRMDASTATWLMVDVASRESVLHELGQVEAQQRTLL